MKKRLTFEVSLDIQYHALRLAYGDRPFMAPIDEPAVVLDVGTGTGKIIHTSFSGINSNMMGLVGIWAMDVGQLSCEHQL